MVNSTIIIYKSVVSEDDKVMERVIYYINIYYKSYLFTI